MGGVSYLEGAYKEEGLFAGSEKASLAGWAQGARVNGVPEVPEGRATIEFWQIVKV